jgi:hypothetical protein
MGAGGIGALSAFTLLVACDFIDTGRAAVVDAAVPRTGCQLARALASVSRTLRRDVDCWAMAFEASNVAASSVKQKVQLIVRTGFTNGFLVSMRESCVKRALEAIASSSIDRNVWSPRTSKRQEKPIELGNSQSFHKWYRRVPVRTSTNCQKNQKIRQSHLNRQSLAGFSRRVPKELFLNSELRSFTPRHELRVRFPHSLLKLGGLSISTN